MSDARKRAEEALAAYDRCKGYEADEYAMACIEPFRALLAEPAPAARFVSRNEEWGLRPDITTTGVPAPAADAVAEAAETYRAARTLAEAPVRDHFKRKCGLNDPDYDRCDCEVAQDNAACAVADAVLAALDARRRG